MSSAESRNARGLLRPATQIALIVCTLALLAGNFLLLRQNDRLRRDAGLQTRSMAPLTGATLEPLRGLTRGGEPLTIDYREDARQTLLVVFSTECQISEANWPYWRQLAARVDRGAFRVVFVNLSQSVPDEYANAHAIPNDAVVVAKLDPASAFEHRLSLSPNVLLIGADGVVRDSWLGSELQTRRTELERSVALQ